MKGYSSRAFLSNYTAIADSKWWRKLTDTNGYCFGFSSPQNSAAYRLCCGLTALIIQKIGDRNKGYQLEGVKVLELILKEGVWRGE